MKLGIDNWRQQLRDAANRAGLPRFWRWWVGELAPLLPSKSRIAFQRRFARPVIELAEGEAVFWRPDFSDGATRLVIAERVSLNGDAAAVLAAGRSAVAHLAANASGGIAAPKVAVALGARQVLRKELTLPAAVEQNLEQTLAYDLDRHTPFRPEQLYFDVVVVGRDAQRKLLRVDWAAALRTIVDEARRRVEEWGAVPVAVVPGPPTARTRLNLIPHGVRPRPLQWRRWQVWAPLAAVAVFAFAAVIVPLVQKRQYAIALNAMDADARQVALAADKVRTQLDGMQNEYNYILAKKYAYPNTVNVLDEVTRVLPDDTWLTQLELKTIGRGKDMHRDLYLRGESANAGKLIALLEDSKLVEQTAPRSPTTKIQGAPGEVFDLSTRLRELPLPAPEPVTIAAAPMPSPAAAVPAAPPQAASAPAAAPDVAPASAATSAPAPQNVPQGVAATAAAGFGPFPSGVAPAAPPPRAARQPPVPASQSAPAAAQPPPARGPGATLPAPGPGAAVASPGALPPAPGVPPQPSTEVPPAPVMPGSAPVAPLAAPAPPQQNDEDN